MVEGDREKCEEVGGGRDKEGWEEVARGHRKRCRGVGGGKGIGGGEV